MILDTNALSRFVDDDVDVVRIVAATPEVMLSSIGLGEYRFGLIQSRRRSYYEHWLATEFHRLPVLGVDEVTALHYAEIRLELKKAGTPIPVNDLWIAALCRQHRRRILSRDRHFDLVRGLRRVGW